MPLEILFVVHNLDLNRKYMNVVFTLTYYFVNFGVSCLLTDYFIRLPFVKPISQIGKH